MTQLKARIKVSPDLMERISLLADMADTFFHEPRTQPLLDADDLRRGMQHIRDELRDIFIDVTGDNPWHEPPL